MAEKSSMQEVVNFDHNEALETDAELEARRADNGDSARSNSEIAGEISEDIDRGYGIVDRMHIQDARARIRRHDMIGKMTGISEDMKSVLENMPAYTGIGREKYALDKMLAALEMGRHLEKTGLLQKPLYYLGANADCQFPLAIGGRKIRMVDPVYGEKRGGVADRIEAGLSAFDNFRKEDRDGSLVFSFDFDFGKGEKERVEISVISSDSAGVAYEDGIGGAVSFLTGPIVIENKEIYERLEIGGIIFDGANSSDDAFNNIAMQELREERQDFDEFADYQEMRRLAMEKAEGIAKAFGFETGKVLGSGERYYIKKEESGAWKKLIGK